MLLRYGPQMNLNMCTRNLAAVPFAVAVLVATVATGSGCSSDVIYDEVPSNMVSTRVAPAYVTPARNDFNLDIRLTYPDLDSLRVQSGSTAQVRFTVWAYDALVADVSATPIVTEDFKLRPSSFAYPLRFSSTALDKIEIQSGDPESIRYYVTLFVDVDGDGVSCNGDLRPDRTISRPQFYTLNDTDNAVELALKAVQGEVCN